LSDKSQCPLGLDPKCMDAFKYDDNLTKTKYVNKFNYEWRFVSYSGQLWIIKDKSNKPLHFELNTLRDFLLKLKKSYFKFLLDIYPGASKKQIMFRQRETYGLRYLGLYKVSKFSYSFDFDKKAILKYGDILILINKLNYLIREENKKLEK
ncbi:unnamed protein product, partial [marine sediment metagenome]